MFRTHTCGELRKEHVGKDVTLSGWVHKRRDLGGLVFIDLRDRYGITQVVFHPETTTNFDLADSLKYEYVVKVAGTIVARDQKAVNDKLETGEIEVSAVSLEILSAAKVMPFEIFETGKGEEDEELRLKYRFLELRREKLKNNLLFRNKMEQFIHAYMQARSFVHLSTPILTVSSPEGARDFLVPSRIHPGKFYALPQAPQQYKQLLMVAGMDRYYQIAPCMRDEDPRADRSPGEFYQLDCETSFMTSNEFFDLMEPLFIGLTEDVAGKKVQQKPFPRIPYQEVMETYGSDRPDLRYDLKIQNVTDWAKESDFTVFKKAAFVRVLVVPGADGFSRKEIEDELQDKAMRAHAKGLAWMKCSGGKFEGGITKFFTAEQLNKLKTLVDKTQPHLSSPSKGEEHTVLPLAKGEQEGVTDHEDALYLFVADSWQVSCAALGAVRSYLGKKLALADPNVIAWAWVVDFPMFEYNEEFKKIDFGHNPFSMPKGGMEALTSQEPLEVKADQYDIIANGLELSSGAVRNYDPEVMYKAFKIAGYNKEQVNAKFGHMLDAFSYGAPPHCGFAPGIERLVMVLLGEENIRSVMPFPKNGRAEEPMMGSPAPAEDWQLKELGLKITHKK